LTTIECVAAVSALVLHCAVRVLPEPPRATAAQPAIETPPSVKLTVPVGLKPVTEAVKVTLAPATDGLAELDSAVVLVALLTTCEKLGLVEPLLVALPLYTALMLCVAMLRLLVAQVAVRILPEPVSAAAVQPAIEVAPSLKFTVPVGALPLTVAVKVTLVPAVEGVNELPIPVVLVAPLTVWESAALLDVALAASPLYVATMLCVPAASVLLVHAAVRLLPLPANTTAEQPPIDVAPSLKLTVPVGLAPVTVAVKVTFVPAVDGLEELMSVVVVAVPPAVVTLTVSALALAPITMMLMPYVLSR
jgi:hypothetical protein